VVHFHGGLVAKADGKNIAQALYESCYGGGSAFPVFFVWESGIKHTLLQSLPRIFAETIFRELVERVAQFAVGKIDQQARRQVSGARGEIPFKPISRYDVLAEMARANTGGEPFADKDPAVIPPGETLEPEEEKAFYHKLATDGELMKQAGQIVNWVRSSPEAAAQPGVRTRCGTIQGSVSTLMSAEVLAEIPMPANTSNRSFSAVALMSRIALGGVRVLKHVIERFSRRRDHGVHATIVEEILREFYLGNIGRAVWQTMKQQSQLAFGTDKDQYGGSAFLEHLRVAYHKGPSPKRVVLVGHSAGAVYLCEFLRAANELLHPDARFDVVLLAPACDFKLLANTLNRYKERIAHCRLFGMCDELERAEFLLDLPQFDGVPLIKHFYPGSLLYLVSGLFEDTADNPLVGMQRSFTNKAAYDAESADYIADVAKYLTTFPQSFVWSKENRGPGLASESTHHGDFDNDPATLQSLAHIVEKGF
jgi:hypothetical protein